MKITVVGLGYVGLSLALLLSKKYDVIGIDNDLEKLKKLNDNLSDFNEAELNLLIKDKNKSLVFSNDSIKAYLTSDIIFLCLPTDKDKNKLNLDTTILQNEISKICEINTNAKILIKSTVPIGFTLQMNLLNQTNKIFFSPEFLREGSSINDTLNPDRLIISNDFNLEINSLVEVVASVSNISDEKILIMTSKEAESVKLFSNSYLAMRVAFFNELDTFCLENEMFTKNVINGISLDKRIGSSYNNPSFGYGGYCLPKDSQQLLLSYGSTKQSLISAIVDSNRLRKEYLVESVLKKNVSIVGIYHLSSKKNSDNYRESANLDIARLLKEKDINVIIYEPTLNVENIKQEFNFIDDFETFSNKSDIILANRLDEKIINLTHKIFTRDVYGNN